MRVEVKPSLVHGIGVFATHGIEIEEWTYVHGMIVPSPSSYGFEHDKDNWWEPFPPFRYVNHSGTPNCEFFMDEDGIMVIQTLREIEPGEELLIDYGFDPEEEYVIPTS